MTVILYLTCWAARRHFVIRCSAASFGAARRMLRGQGPDSQLITLTPGSSLAPLMRQQGLPLRLTVRFVRVRLSTGESEVLVTSLCDERAYPTADFLAFYHQRWGVGARRGLLSSYQKSNKVAFKINNLQKRNKSTVSGLNYRP